MLCRPQSGGRPRVLSDKKCETCGKLYWPATRFSRYCSRECWPGGRPIIIPDKICPACGKIFHPHPKEKKFCSRKCVQLPRMPDRPCERCGKIFTPIRETHRFCSTNCAPSRPRNWKDRACETCGEMFRPKKNGQRFHSRACYLAKYKNKRIITVQGYVMIYAPDHSSRKSGQALEHRIVMEKHIGRHLTNQETVHHINGNKSDNRIENL
jgi:hypothetical protein